MVGSNVVSVMRPRRRRRLWRRKISRGSVPGWLRKLLEPETRGMLAIAIARELRQIGLEYEHDMAHLGEWLDSQH
jgi:hypothetical protein